MTILSDFTSRQYRTASMVIALACVTLGLVVLLGWQFDLTYLKSIYLGGTSMYPNAALGFIFAGTVLWLNCREDMDFPMRNVLLYVLSALVLGIGLFTLLEYIFGINLGVDYLYHSQTRLESHMLYPGRISLAGAISYTLAGAALIMLNRHARPWAIHIVCIAFWLVAVFSMVTLIHMSETDSLIYTQMAFHTAFAFFLLAPGIIMATPNKGLLAVLKGHGSSGIIARRFLPFAIVVPIVLAWLRLEGERAGLFLPQFGWSLYVILNIVIFLLIILWNIRAITAIETERLKAQEELESKGMYIKDFEGRVNKILEALLQFTQMDFSMRLPISEKSDELDAISLALNTLSEEIQEKNLSIQQNAERVNEIMDVLLKYTMMDFSDKVSMRDTGDEWDAIALGLNTLSEELEASIASEKARREELEEASMQLSRKNEILTGLSELNDVIKGQKTVGTLAQDIINKLCSFLNAQVGAVYVYHDSNSLRFSAGYAYSRDNRKDVVAYGEGLVGQAAMEKRLITFADVPTDYLKISSALGEVSPKHIFVVPFLFEGNVIGVIEIGSIYSMSELQIEYLKVVSENVAVALNSAMSREKLEELYLQTQQQAEELESQQEELRQTNEELTRQTHMLQTSEEELRVQQEELQQANEELEQKTQELTEKNEAIEEARIAISEKAEEIARTSRYKSEFLANMSHELRTPLNSILILAKLLNDNKDHNLSDKQVEYSNIIYKSGADLLSLINDILDLSKIEAGKVELNLERCEIRDLKQDMLSMFKELAMDKKITFNIELARNVESASIHTDKIRLEQVIRNLLSNAFKFTAGGGKVGLKFAMAAPNTVFKSEKIKRAGQVVSIAVTDTGIGIPKDKLEIIFEAFQQADGSTSRRYGGTGLGLSISRELIALLGGEIHVESKENAGSKFTVYIPAEGVEINQLLSENENTVSSAVVIESSLNEALPELNDDRKDLGKADKTILIIEDDHNFAKILQDFAHERGYKTIIAHRGDKGYEYAQLYKPNAIILDIQLPILDGWGLLKKFKEDQELKHIPIHIMSVVDKKKLGLEMGAIAYLQKPVSYHDLDKAFETISSTVSTHLKNILIIEDNAEHNKSIVEMLKENEEQVNCVSAYSGNEGLEKLHQQPFDCIILDLGLKDMTGYELLDKIRSQKEFAGIPIIVNTGRDLTKEEELKLRKHATTVVLKSSESHKRLLDETALFLHKVEETTKKASLSPARSLPHKVEEILQGKTALLADDDMRNLFSLTAALEQQGLKIVAASDGREALKKLSENPGIDIVLMDIMMPEMDGYEAMREIRKKQAYKDLPILALTAKAMKGDKEKCIEAGASDYISKPVNVEQLLSLMRAWLYK